MRRLLLILSMIALAALPLRAEVPLTADSVCRALDAMPLHKVEGIWQLTDVPDLTIVVWRHPGTRQDDTAVPVYDIQLLSAADRSRLPGEMLGQMHPTARPDFFDCTISTHFDKRGVPTRSARYTVELVDDAHLSFRPVNHGVRLSPILLVPPLLRRGIRIGSDRDKSLDGAIKVYPEVPVRGRPRYL